jgi:hypothetical protein
MNLELSDEETAALLRELDAMATVISCRRASAP